MSAASGEPEVIVYDVRGEGPMPEGSYVTEAAYLTLAQQRDATERLCAQHEGKIHELRDQLAFAESALSGGLAENESLRARVREVEGKREAMEAREANVRQRARAACARLIEAVGADGPTNVEDAAERAADTIESLRARLAACERDAARYQWLKERLLGAHFGYEGTVPPSCVLTFKVPDTMRVSGNLDVTIDAALTTDDDFGPNDGHEVTL